MSDQQMMAHNIIITAGNVVGGDNPAYTLDDFYIEYPAYAPRTIPPVSPATDPTITYILNPVILQMYIGLADECIKESRWHSMWKVAMGWFVAHFATLYLQGMADANSTAQQVIAKGQAKGLMASKSIGDVSVSYDFGSIGADLDGWADWKLTIYGTQLATFGKNISRGSMMVW